MTMASSTTVDPPPGYTFKGYRVVQPEDNMESRWLTSKGNKVMHPEEEVFRLFTSRPRHRVMHPEEHRVIVTGFQTPRYCFRLMQNETDILIQEYVRKEL